MTQMNQYGTSAGPHVRAPPYPLHSWQGDGSGARTGADRVTARGRSWCA
jgi:hypothetical protein